MKETRFFEFKKTYQKSNIKFSYDVMNDMKLTSDEKDKLDMLRSYQQRQWFVEVVRVAEGGTFGEIALMNMKEGKNEKPGTR